MDTFTTHRASHEKYREDTGRSLDSARKYCITLLRCQPPAWTTMVFFHTPGMGTGCLTVEHSISGHWLYMLYILYVGLLASHQMGTVYGWPGRGIERSGHGCTTTPDIFRPSPNPGFQRSETLWGCRAAGICEGLIRIPVL